jgi:hypothetical protein
MNDQPSSSPRPQPLGPLEQVQPAVACCCPPPPAGSAPLVGPWLEGTVSTPVGEIPRVSATLRPRDHLGAWKVRWGIGRLHYRIAPGLYAVGSPTPESPVLVSANYKLSFDRLRSRLAGRNAWLLVLDTRGINVWCAAGKGTFGTEELVQRIAAVRLDGIVTHRTLIVPQLGATGVCAHEVKNRSGFKVVFGPVQAEDLPAFLDTDLKATPKMRQITFPFSHRIVLIPVEIVGGAKLALLVAAGLILLSGLGGEGYSPARLLSVGLTSALLWLGAVLAAAALVPALLPWLPGRAFAIKGAAVGAIYIFAVAWYASAHPGIFASGPAAAAWLFIILAVTSFIGMNFTGASTYTSLSGVLKEMKIAVPWQIGFAVIGAGLWIAGLFV